ncbi:RDD family protein [Undibacterium squillarum]|uniref:RDD family protein n=1 Tax=Undibacterium squillarum TaxID=1131567 RepID=UPI0035B3EE93
MTEPVTFTTPSIRRRLTCMLYEGMLLFGLVFITGFLFDVLTQSRHALLHRHTRQGFLFLVIGIYFVYCWTRSGQTLAMQTWRIRVTDLDGKPLPRIKAVVRYVLCWMWFLPAMALAFQFSLQKTETVIALFAGVAGWAMTALLDPERQFMHDKLAKTRLTELPAAAKSNYAE